MIELTHRTTGHAIRTDDASVGFWQAAGYRGAESRAYAGMKVAELRAEIERRNDGRDEAGLLSTEGKKAELVAVLEADDSK